MMKKYKTWIELVVVTLITLAIVIPTLMWMPGNITALKKNNRSNMAPVIMVPGSSATKDRFDALVNELNAESQGHSLLKVEVDTNGKLSYTGSIKRGDRSPFIVVSFQDNADGESHIKKQAGWLATAVSSLAQTYKFNHFSGMGHSNGGLAWTLYLENSIAKTNLTMDRLMTIGTPFNLAEKSDTTQTSFLKEMVAKKKNLPKSLIMYSVAGTEDYNGDGIVPVNSVTAGKYIYQNQVQRYTELTVTGADTNHSDLPENKEIVAAIRQYLLSERFDRAPGVQKPRERTITSAGDH